MLISAGSIIRESVDLYKDNAKLFIRYVLLSLVPSLLVGAITGGALVSTIFLNGDSNTALLIGGAIVFAILTLIAIYLALWVNVAFIQTMNRAYTKTSTLSIKESLQQARKYIWPSLGTSILVGLYSAWPLILGAIGMGIASMLSGSAASVLQTLSALLMFYGIFHAIYYSIKLVFATYEVVLADKKVRESLAESKATTANRWWAILWRIIAPGFVFGAALWVLTLALEGFARMFDSGTMDIVMGALAMLAQLLITPLAMAAILILYRHAKQTPAAATPNEPTESLNS